MSKQTESQYWKEDADRVNEMARKAEQMKATVKVTGEGRDDSPGVQVLKSKSAKPKQSRP